MAQNIITAQEACRIAKEASRMENIMRSIHGAAEDCKVLKGTFYRIE